MNTKTCIIICGPTAVGKTDAAIQVAQHFNTEIISADSRQCFVELNIGVAKPSEQQLASIQHHFINSHSIHQNVSAADYEKYALQKIEQIFEKNHVAVVCGGTGLYIKAFTNGLDDIAPIASEIKKELEENYNINGIAWLRQKIEIEDPLFFADGEIQNPRRLLRALEVIRSTGISILQQQTNIKKIRPFNIIKIGLELPRQQLYDRINSRVDVMMQAGLDEEAQGLIQFKNLNALQTVGYRELFAYFDGITLKEKAVELIKQNSRHYAKRQMTWFKKDDEINWLNADEILPFVKQISL